MDDSTVCCCHNPAPQDPFDMAWKAIEDGDFSKLKQAIQEMKASKGGSSALLDTCRLIKKSGVAYSMSLLALCGFHGNVEMVNLLLEEGADMKAECVCEIHTGTTVLQMMFHCFNQKEYDKLSITILDYFIKRGANLGGKISTHHFDHDGSDSGGVNYGILHLPLEMQRIDCAKMLVEAGVEPINGGTCIGEDFEVVQMFEEYRLNGTNEFICWVFNEYIPNHPEVDLKRIIQSLINMKKKDENSCFWQFEQRAPGHAILTSHHEETIKRLIQCGKENGLDLLAERSCTAKTALHVAAENNDVKSVHILLRLGADMRASDYSDMNPFMLAVEKHHLEVVKAMIKKDPGLVSLSMGCGSTAIHWALEEGHNRSAFFKGFIEENPEALLTAEDFQGNTVAHLVAASGNTEVFEMLWSEKFAEAVFSDRNLEDKTPLQLAVENGHVNILKTLKTCVDGGREAEQRETKPPLWLRRLKTEWENKMVTSFLYASSCGSLGAVKFLLASRQKPNISHNGKTPLLCAAEAGHDEIVTYLLQFESVLTDLRKQPEVVKNASVSPLLMAAQNGHTKCVTLLLQNGANVLQRDSEDRNCLMIAIQNHHKATALAILAEENGIRLSSERNKNPIPLHLLVKEMPDLAEYVLNKCIIEHSKKVLHSKEVLRSADAKDFVDGPSDTATNTANQPVKNKFDFLEDQTSHEQRDNHILVWMIKHNRLTLLHHPLVKDYLYEKFWLMTFPHLLLNLLFNIALLITLNWFALIVPRPGPDSETCPENNGTNTACEGQTEDDRRFLATTTLLLYFLCFIGFLVEISQLAHRGCKRYFKDSDNYIQVFLYTLTVIFLYGFDNKCWCSTPSQWQIGAFAVFLSWLNFIFILKYMPCTAVPINMFLSICVTFLKLIHLLFVLIFAFGVPFYMVFVRTTSSSEELAAYRSPSHAIAKTLLQLAGEFDFEDTFNRGDLLYTPTTYILFITFLITMPILFSNLLIGLAVGEAEKKLEKAKLTTIKLQVESILDHNDSPYSQWFRKHHFGFVVTFFAKGYSRCINFILKTFFLKVKCTPHDKMAKELKEQNDGIYRTVMAQNPMREDIKLREDMKQEMIAQRDDIANLKEDMAKLVRHLTPIGGN